MINLSDKSSLENENAKMLFRKKIEPQIFKHPETECWEFTGRKNLATYGRIIFGKRPYRIDFPAHRLSYIANVGQIPPGLFVLHKCDFPPCCNPEHLFLGTNRDNLRDAIRKGRFSKSKLGEDKVKEIKRRLIESSYYGMCISLAKEFSVSRETICLIKSGKRWKGIQP